MMTDIELNQEDTVAFIDVWESERLLWDPTHAGYTNRAARKLAFEALGSTFGFSEEQARRKAESLRASYKRIKRKQCGPYPNPITWPHFERLHSFLGTIVNDEPGVTPGARALFYEDGSDSGTAGRDLLEENGDETAEEEDTSDVFYINGDGQSDASAPIMIQQNGVRTYRGNKRCRTIPISAQYEEIVKRLKAEPELLHNIKREPADVDSEDTRLQEYVSMELHTESGHPPPNPQSGENQRMSVKNCSRQAQYTQASVFRNYGLSVADRLARLSSCEKVDEKDMRKIIACVMHKIDTALFDAESEVVTVMKDK